ncbi:MAG: inorganic diphosphatase [Proteobacteria bacterium]|nr:inorganic diphosphatase [Pseudomonadota bacterium]
MKPNEPLTVRIETPRGGFIKRRADGRIDYISPLPSPFNYGCVPGVLAGDGDPLDAVVLGSRKAAGRHVETQAWAWIDFEDAGQPDPKVVCGSSAPTQAERATVVRFFQLYAVLKGLLNRARGKRGPTVSRGWKELSSWETEAAQDVRGSRTGA